MKQSCNMSVNNISKTNDHRYLKQKKRTVLLFIEVLL